MKQRVFVVDDEETIRKLLVSRLQRENFDVVACASAQEAMAAFEIQAPSVMVTDLKMPGKDGFELMSWARAKSQNLKMIMITGHGEKQHAVRALREGACDYLEKPFDMDELTHTVQRAAHEWKLEQDSHDYTHRLEARVERIEGKDEDKFWFVSKAKSMSKVNEWMTVLRRESMRGDVEEPSVLIQGDSGTGKEGIARMVHAGSRRARGPWVAVNCANFNEQLLESELFGHEKGAFTGANRLKQGLFEIARNGTLLLDEIGEMDVKLQAKLLRVLQEKVFRRVGGTQDLTSDVRVIAATNRDLQGRVANGQFREDLYHRLSKVVMEVPSLKDRYEDLIPMAEQFFEKAFRQRGKNFAGLATDAVDCIKAYTWPGNVREMLNVIERVALVWSGSGPVAASHLGIQLGYPGNGNSPSASNAAGGSPIMSTAGARLISVNGMDGYMSLKKKWTDSFEREYLMASLSRHGGNVSAAAREAQLDRSNFLRLLRKHELKANEFRKAA